MDKARMAAKQVVGLMAGLALLALFAVAFLSSGAQAHPAAGSSPPHTTGTWMWPTWPPFATHTPCSNCTPGPTWTPRPPFATWTPRPTPLARPLPTRTPRPEPSITRTPPALPAILLVPSVQFGFGHAGSTVDYHELLLNHVTQATQVNLSGSSFGMWGVSIHPTSLTALPGISNTIGVSVTVPMSPTYPADVERIAAVTGGTPYTTTAYIITLATRTSFNDMAQDHWADGPVQYLVSLGVVSGYPDGTFRPDASVTRAQIAKMLVGAMGWELITPKAAHFSDVPPDYWAYSYIETAAAHDAVSGYSDGTFNPGIGVTRAEVAKMVSIAREWHINLPASPSYADEDASEWYFPYVEVMRAAGVMSGYPDGTFNPDALTTRAQVAKILSLSLYSDPNQ